MLRKDKLEGFGVFTHELLSRITSQHPEHEFMFLFDRPFDERFIYSDNVHPYVLYPPASHPLLLKFWYQYRLRWFIDNQKPDVLISPDGGIPLQTGIKTLSVIHDLNFEHFPEDLPEGVGNYYRNYYRQIARRATRLVTVSEFSKKDIVDTYEIDPDKIDVVYNAVGDKFMPLGEAEAKKVREEFSGSQPYFLFVGSIHQRKNLPKMMEAFTRFRITSSTPFKFIIAGAKRWWNSEMENAYATSPYKNDIVFIGRIDDEKLPKITGAAFTLLFASRFEGFGIPIVEAMKCGVPVITSDTSSMPEVAGGAAMLVNPEDVEGICAAMNKIVQDEKLRINISSLGKERAKSFSWDNSARSLWSSIKKTVSH